MIVLTKQEDIEAIMKKSPLEVAVDVIELEKEHLNQDVCMTDKDIEEKVRVTIDATQTILGQINQTYKANNGKTIGDLVNEALAKAQESK